METLSFRERLALKSEQAKQNIETLTKYEDKEAKAIQSLIKGTKSMASLPY